MKHKGVTINRIYREGEELVSYCLSQIETAGLEEWLRDVYRFVLEWISDEEKIVAYTSGSTGRPKQISLEKKHIIASAAKTIAFLGLKPGDSALLCLSDNYIAGKMMIARAFEGGLNLLLAEPKGNALEGIKEMIDFVALVPLQAMQSIDEIRAGKAKNIIIGGGAVSGELNGLLQEAECNCYETYGMTETVSHVAMRKIGEGWFCAMPGVVFSTDERNCLVINALDVLFEPITTNDIVELKNSGSFKLLGRIDNIINSGGVKIIPEQIELELKKHLDVEFYISSIKDRSLGEKVVLVIEGEVGMEKGKQCLVNLSSIDKFKRPKAILSVDRFPMTPNGKIRREELRCMIS